MNNCYKCGRPLVDTGDIGGVCSQCRIQKSFEKVVNQREIAIRILEKTLQRIQAMTEEEFLKEYGGDPFFKTSFMEGIQFINIDPTEEYFKEK